MIHVFCFVLYCWVVVVVFFFFFLIVGVAVVFLALVFSLSLLLLTFSFCRSCLRWGIVVASFGNLYCGILKLALHKGHDLVRAYRSRLAEA